MNNIKFRAWIEEYQELCDVPYIDFCNNCFYILPYAELEGGNQIEIKDKMHLLEQFTGQKDRTGTELYENDIVKVIYDDWISKSENDTRTTDDYLWENVAEIGIICFDEESFEFCIKLHDDTYNVVFDISLRTYRHGFIEKIGTTHDNKDLSDVKSRFKYE